MIRFVDWIAVSKGKFYEWRKRYGKANEHNALVPRDHWITNEERQAILDFEREFPLEGYRRLTFMMLDRDVVAVSPSTVYRVLSKADRLNRWNRTPSKKGTGFKQPLRPHQHWHIDVAYLNVSGTFYYLCSILDGMSRSIVHWEIRESKKEAEIECIIERARDKFPGAKPRIISDNGPQFVARDFKAYIRICGMTHVRTSPYYPQSNGKLERYHRTIKSEAIRPASIASLQEAINVVTGFVEHYNAVRLHSALGYVAPNDVLAGKAKAILEGRDRKLAEARERRAQQRQAARQEAQAIGTSA